ncbi:acetyltransferase, GNAT family [Candidatus Rhodobacter oscarellae]|uniref:Acetyltransferase, GNAT family n=1 Tax=Candidatus Rhodobacter oscarellae TaxID=1675527 RepID=A0A0J9E0S4_9RHOB|nr:GNAT family N-acetyltransferase [Candidatus Rhodobacter lobularis]KMW56325.1 acetyltransferase, GNAT family [Candidatus Rhodobacter lobularis]
MTDVITIRCSEPYDLAPLDELFARSYPKLLKADYAPSVLVTALPLISKAQPALLRSGTYYVAETADGTLIGAGGWTRGRRRGSADIRHVITDASQVRRGVGRAIVARVFEEARAAGVTALQCKSTRTAVPFYEAMGFKALDAFEMELRPGIHFPAIQMHRSL